jgi:hypothetical protein
MLSGGSVDSALSNGQARDQSSSQVRLPEDFAHQSTAGADHATCAVKNRIVKRDDPADNLSEFGPPVPDDSAARQPQGINSSVAGRHHGQVLPNHGLRLDGGTQVLCPCFTYPSPWHPEHSVGHDYRPVAALESHDERVPSGSPGHRRLGQPFPLSAPHRRPFDNPGDRILRDALPGGLGLRLDGDGPVGDNAVFRRDQADPRAGLQELDRRFRAGCRGGVGKIPGPDRPCLTSEDSAPYDIYR